MNISSSLQLHGYSSALAHLSASRLAHNAIAVATTTDARARGSKTGDDAARTTNYFFTWWNPFVDPFYRLHTTFRKLKSLLCTTRPETIYITTYRPPQNDNINFCQLIFARFSPSVYGLFIMPAEHGPECVVNGRKLLQTKGGKKKNFCRVFRRKNNIPFFSVVKTMFFVVSAEQHSRLYFLVKYAARKAIGGTRARDDIRIYYSLLASALFLWRWQADYSRERFFFFYYYL